MESKKIIISVVVVVIAIVLLVNNFNNLTGAVVRDEFPEGKMCSGTDLSSKRVYTKGTYTDTDCKEYCLSKNAECCQIYVYTDESEVHCYAKAGYVINTVLPTKEYRHGAILMDYSVDDDMPYDSTDVSSETTKLKINYFQYRGLEISEIANVDPDRPNVIPANPIIKEGASFQIAIQIENIGDVADNKIDVRLDAPEFIKVKGAYFVVPSVRGGIIRYADLDIPNYPSLEPGKIVWINFDVKSLSIGSGDLEIVVDGTNSNAVTKTKKIRVVSRAVRCTDSDGHLSLEESYYVKGKVEDEEEIYEDECGTSRDGKYLKEYVCEIDLDGNPHAMYYGYICPNGCSNGACISGTPATPTEVIYQGVLEMLNNAEVIESSSVRSTNCNIICNNQGKTCIHAEIEQYSGGVRPITCSDSKTGNFFCSCTTI